MPVFDASIDVEDGFVVPHRIARFGGEMVPVVAVATDPSHHVDTRAAAGHLAHRVGDGAVVEVGVRLAVESPVAFGPQVGGPLTRGDDLGDVVGAASLDQQHVDARVLGQSARDERTQGTRTAHDEVVARLEDGRQSGLVRRDTLGEFLVLVEFVCRVLHLASVPGQSPVTTHYWSGRDANLARACQDVAAVRKRQLSAAARYSRGDRPCAALKSREICAALTSPHRAPIALTGTVTSSAFARSLRQCSILRFLIHSVTV